VLDEVGGASLAQERLGRELRTDHGAVRELERGALAELGVNHRVHRGHATAAKLALDAPHADLHSGREGGGAVPPAAAGRSARERRRFTLRERKVDRQRARGRHASHSVQPVDRR
jgi:hypothetical protein